MARPSIPVDVIGNTAQLRKQIEELSKTPVILNVQTNQRGLDKNLSAQARGVSGIGAEFAAGAVAAKSFNRPLGTINGNLSEIDKSLGAANARVIAFGASAGAIFAVQNAVQQLFTSFVNTEKQLASINTVLNLDQGGLKNFGKQIFKTAGQTGQSFDVASEAALEFSRQGLGVEQTVDRTRQALILSRLSGLDAAASVDAITASVNSYRKEGLTASEVVNKLANVDAGFAVSSADLAQALSRVGSSAQDAGVSFDELIALVTSAQQTTARGGAVIGNSFKTIFTRLNRERTRELFGDLGISLVDEQGNEKNQIALLKDLAGVYNTLGTEQKNYVAEQVGGVFQLNILKAALSDLGRSYSIYDRALDTSLGTTNEAEKRNEQLNQTLAGLGTQTLANVQSAASTIGEGLFAPAAKNVLNVTNFLAESVNTADSSSIGSQLGQGIINGLGSFLSGPGLAVIGAVLAKLFGDFAKYGATAAQSLLGLDSAAKNQAAIQQSVAGFLQKNAGLYGAIVGGQTSATAAAKQYLQVISQQTAALQAQSAIVKAVSQAVVANVGVSRSASQSPAPVIFGGGKKARFAGFVPNFASERDFYQQVENVGADNHGYKAGILKSAIVHDGMGGKQRAWMTSREKKTTVTNAAGYKATTIEPPNGFGPNTMFASSGFVPNFAPNIAAIKELIKRGSTSGEKIAAQAALQRIQSGALLKLGSPEKLNKFKELLYGSKSNAGFNLDAIKIKDLNYKPLIAGAKELGLSAQDLEMLSNNSIAVQQLRGYGGIKSLSSGFVPNFAPISLAALAKQKISKSKFPEDEDLARSLAVAARQQSIQKKEAVGLTCRDWEELYKGKLATSATKNIYATVSGKASEKNQDLIKDYGSVSAKPNGVTLVYPSKASPKEYGAEVRYPDKSKNLYRGRILTTGFNSQVVKGKIPDTKSRMEQSVVSLANDLAKSLGFQGGFSASQIPNSGSIVSAAGTAFELALNGAVENSLRGGGQTARVDFANPNSTIRNLFYNAPGAYEAKQNINPGLVKDVFLKFLSNDPIANRQAGVKQQFEAKNQRQVEKMAYANLAASGNFGEFYTPKGKPKTGYALSSVSKEARLAYEQALKAEREKIKMQLAGGPAAGPGATCLSSGFIPNFAGKFPVNGRNIFQAEWFKQIAKKRGINLKDPSAMYKLAVEFSKKYPNTQGMFGFSGGFIPNFANINDAQRRALKTEKSYGAGAVLDEYKGMQYVRQPGQSSNFKTMIKQDHPEGLAMAIKKSAKSQGLSRGFIPNFAPDSGESSAFSAAAIQSLLMTLAFTFPQRSEIDTEIKEQQKKEIKARQENTKNLKISSKKEEFERQKQIIREKAARQQELKNKGLMGPTSFENERKKLAKQLRETNNEFKTSTSKINSSFERLGSRTDRLLEEGKIRPTIGQGIKGFGRGISGSPGAKIGFGMAAPIIAETVAGGLGRETTAGKTVSAAGQGLGFLATGAAIGGVPGAIAGGLVGAGLTYNEYVKASTSNLSETSREAEKAKTEAGRINDLAQVVGSQVSDYYEALGQGGPNSKRAIKAKDDAMSTIAKFGSQNAEELTRAFYQGPEIFYKEIEKVQRASISDATTKQAINTFESVAAETRNAQENAISRFSSGAGYGGYKPSSSQIEDLAFDLQSLLFGDLRGKDLVQKVQKLGGIEKLAKPITKATEDNFAQFQKDAFEQGVGQAYFDMEGGAVGLAKRLVQNKGADVGGDALSKSAEKFLQNFDKDIQSFRTTIESSIGKQLSPNQWRSVRDALQNVDVVRDVFSRGVLSPFVEAGRTLEGQTRAEQNVSPSELRARRVQEAQASAEELLKTPRDNFAQIIAQSQAQRLQKFESQRGPYSGMPSRNETAEIERQQRINKTQRKIDFLKQYGIKASMPDLNAIIQEAYTARMDEARDLGIADMPDLSKKIYESLRTEVLSAGGRSTADIAEDTVSRQIAAEQKRKESAGYISAQQDIQKAVYDAAITPFTKWTENGEAFLPKENISQSATKLKEMQSELKNVQLPVQREVLNILKSEQGVSPAEALNRVIKDREQQLADMGPLNEWDKPKKEQASILQAQKAFAQSAQPFYQNTGAMQGYQDISARTQGAEMALNTVNKTLSTFPANAVPAEQRLQPQVQVQLPQIYGPAQQVQGLSIAQPSITNFADSAGTASQSANGVESSFQGLSSQVGTLSQGFQNLNSIVSQSTQAAQSLSQSFAQQQAPAQQAQQPQQAQGEPFRINLEGKLPEPKVEIGNVTIDVSSLDSIDGKLGQLQSSIQGGLSQLQQKITQLETRISDVALTTSRGITR